MFWVYFVGGAMTAAKIAVGWSGLVFGIVMFMFVAMPYPSSTLTHVNARFIWTIVFRESSFGAPAGFLRPLPRTEKAR